MIRSARWIACLLCACGTEPALVETPPDAAEEQAAPTEVDPVAAALAELGVDLDSGAGKVRISGWVNMQSGLVEVFACSPEGKTHEAVVVLDCVPRGLHAGLLALGLEPGAPAELGTDGSYRAPTGDLVEVRVRWTGEDGIERVARAEDWVWNQVEGRPMKAAPWIFAGSFRQPAPGGEVYAADSIKSLVTTYHDATSILENPHGSGVDDTLYYSNERVVPAAGTPIVVELFAAKGAR